MKALTLCYQSLWAQSSVQFAVIGDYGDIKNPEDQQFVAEMVIDELKPQFVITVGDNNYADKWDIESFDEQVGDYWCTFLSPAWINESRTQGRATDWRGRDCTHVGENKFFPTPGNHDYDKEHNTSKPFQRYK